MKSIHLFILIALFPLNLISAQDIFIAKSDNGIYQLMPDGNIKHIVSIKLSLDNLIDIAISPENKLYGVTTRNGLVEINWQSGDFETISNNLYFNAKSLVSANENELYYLASTSLYKYNLALDSSILIEDLGYSTPGDICLYKRNIVFPTLYDIKAYNLDSKKLSTIHCFPEVQVHWGISTLFADCESSSIILSKPSTASSPDFVKIDLETGISTPFEAVGFSTVQIYGMATNEESAGISCERYDFTDIDCDKIVSSGMELSPQNEIIIYPNPTQHSFYIEGCSSVYDVDLYDSKGILIARHLKTNGKIDISHLNAGLYYTAITCGTSRSIRKVIKQ